MTTIGVRSEERTIPARDGFELGATVYRPATDDSRMVIINGATAVPHRFYRRFAEFLAGRGYIVVAYDYRGIGASRPESLRGFDARMRDWAFLDMAGILDWAATSGTDRRFLVGHSFGGQMVGMLDEPDLIDAMVTFSSQSGHWRMMGGDQKYVVAFHHHVTLPGLSKLFGYTPWSTFGAGEDLPGGVASEWAAWGRSRRYLLDDDSLPLERYSDFTAPVLAYSFDDDTWGTAESVDFMMSVYPNVERRHVVPADHDLDGIGHMGFFRPKSDGLWPEVAGWLDAH